MEENHIRESDKIDDVGNVECYCTGLKDPRTNVIKAFGFERIKRRQGNIDVNVRDGDGL